MGISEHLTMPNSNEKELVLANTAPTDLTSQEAIEKYPSGWRPIVILTSLSLTLLLVALDNNILAVAIPEITTYFHSLEDVGWYGSAYLLAVTALQPMFGSILKYASVKKTYLTCIVIFEGNGLD